MTLSADKSIERKLSSQLMLFIAVIHRLCKTKGMVRKS